MSGARMLAEILEQFDSTNSAEIMELLNTLNREQQQTFVIVTHSEEVGALADRIVRMNDGMIIDDGSRGDDSSASAGSRGDDSSASAGSSGASAGEGSKSPGNPGE